MKDVAASVGHREQEMLEAVRQYFVRADSGRSDVLDLFADVQIYFPKFGVSRGKACFGDLASGLLSSIQRIAHHISEFNYIVGANSVAVEGRTYGADKDGAEWNGGETPGGRFCSVFEFRGSLISRMHIYLDPNGSGSTSFPLGAESTVVDDGLWRANHLAVSSAARRLNALYARGG